LPELLSSSGIVQRILWLHNHFELLIRGPAYTRLGFLSLDSLTVFVRDCRFIEASVVFYCIFVYMLAELLQRGEVVLVILRTVCPDN